MIGVVLAGGLGKRLSPLTKNCNKHYLPVYNKRMIELPLEFLHKSGIKDVVIVLGGEFAGDIVNLVQNGQNHGFDSVRYAYQVGYEGIPAALMVAKPLCQGSSSLLVVLGDNYFEEPIAEDVDIHYWSEENWVYTQERDDTWNFGVIQSVDEETNYITAAIEKPEGFGKGRAILGAFIFHPDVFDYIENLQKSDRGEFEIIDLLLALKATPIAYGGYWSDMGTFDSLTQVARRLHDKTNHTDNG